ncbi:MAG TPA: hypothetical protein VGF01_06130 [Terracidiphilus sp.]|jgi:hypothetical protein
MLDASNSDQSISSDDLIKKYDMVQKLFVMDTQIYWTRSQLLLVANSALAGFALNSVPINSDAHTVKIWTLFIEAIIGILLCVLWRRAIKSGSGWMNHWKTILIKWEKSIFADENIYRERPKTVPNSSGVAQVAALLFMVLWCTVGIYGLLCLYLRFNGCPLP